VIDIYKSNNSNKGREYVENGHNSLCEIYIPLVDKLLKTPLGIPQFAQGKIFSTGG
jgi:hypothetical protein